MARIDVLLPTYNSAKYLKSAVESIQRQTVSDIRIVIIDDGSTDTTRPLVEDMRASDTRIVYHRQENAGIVAALNAGLKFCDAPYIARHDGDDISYPARFEKELAYLEANPDCVAVSSVGRHIDENGIPRGTISSRKDLDAADCWSIPANEPYLLQPMLMVRRSALDIVGGYRNLAVAEDSDLLWRLNDVGSMYIFPEPLGDYRVHSGSISSQSIVKGRQLAVWSQLAAISEQRRSKKAEDIIFSSELMTRINAAVSLGEMVEAARKVLTDTELTWLRSAVSAKLVELCYYRPYEPDITDIQFIRYAVRSDSGLLRRHGYTKFREGILSAGIRIMLDSRWKDALSLVPISRWPVLFARIAFRMMLPASVKDRIKDIRRSRRLTTEPRGNHSPTSAPKNENPTVAYMILAHSQNEQLDLLVNALLSDPRSRVYIHLDAKTKVDRAFRFDDISRVRITENRVHVNWGGFSVVRAMKNVIKAALEDKSNERFVLISGACFPTRSPSAVNDALLAGNGNLFSIWGQIDPKNLSSEGFGRYSVSKFQPCDIEFLNPKKSIFHARLWNLYKKIAPEIPLERRVSLDDLWKGSQFFAASRSVAEWFIEPHRELDRTLLWGLAPDEIYFNTLFVRYLRQCGETFTVTTPDAAEQGTHYITKRVPEHRTLKQKLLEPIDLRKLHRADLPKILDNSCFFARKCNPELAKEIQAAWGQE